MGMGQEWRIQFTDGHVWASDPAGEPLAGGQWLAGDEPIRAYLWLEHMSLVREGTLRGPNRFRRFWRIFQIRTFPLFTNMNLDILSRLKYLPPPESQHPAPPAQQVQVYEGLMRLSWRLLTRHAVRISLLSFWVPFPRWRWSPWNIARRRTTVGI